jgi:hypothetical protein
MKPEVLTTTIMKIAVLWVAVLRSLVDVSEFCRGISQSSTVKMEAAFLLPHTDTDLPDQTIIVNFNII